MLSGMSRTRIRSDSPNANHAPSTFPPSFSIAGRTASMRFAGFSEQSRPAFRGVGNLAQIVGHRVFPPSWAYGVSAILPNAPKSQDRSRSLGEADALGNRRCVRDANDCEHLCSFAGRKSTACPPCPPCGPREFESIKNPAPLGFRAPSRRGRCVFRSYCALRRFKGLRLEFLHFLSLGWRTPLRCAFSAAQGPSQGRKC